MSQTVNYMYACVIINLYTQKFKERQEFLPKIFCLFTEQYKHASKVETLLYRYKCKLKKNEYICISAKNIIFFFPSITIASIIYIIHLEYLKNLYTMVKIFAIILLYIYIFPYISIRAQKKYCFLIKIIFYTRSKPSICRSTFFNVYILHTHTHTHILYI